MWQILEAIPPLARIADKLIPGRKESLILKLTKLEDEYAKALFDNNDMKVAILQVEMKKLRERIKCL